MLDFPVSPIFPHAVSAEDPPMAVVRKFVHLLDHSDQDFQEELELMRLREEVVTNIRSNQQLENDLNLMDIKIGLLVKNKITLQEVVSHSKKLTKKNKGQLSDMMMMNKQRGGLKALSKEKRVKLEAYQYLFYLLQVTIKHIAFPCVCFNQDLSFGENKLYFTADHVVRKHNA